MNSQFWRNVAGLFEAARSRSASDRPSFLHQAQPEESDIRGEVLDLLAQDEQASREGFFATRSRRGWARPEEIITAPGPSPANSDSVDHARIALVKGSAPRNIAEVEGLFHERMRIGIPILFGAFAIFLLKNLVDGHYRDPNQNLTFLVHALVVLTAAVSAAILWTRRTVGMRILRLIEMVNLASTTLFCAVYQDGQFRMTTWQPWANPEHVIDVLDLASDSCVLRWFAIIIAYGLSVPNTWQRCARTVGAVSLCPMVVVAAVGMREGTIDQLKDVLMEMGIWLFIASAIAVYGCHKITQSRRESIEARKLGQYRLKQRIGRGGMGDVFLAEHRLLKRPCAIKIIRRELLSDRRTLLRFEREVQSTAMLKHPNTVRIYDFGVAQDGTFYYTMEYLPGITLQHMVDEYGPLPPERAIHFLIQVCSSLREAHGLGLVHRDIKPGNLLACQLGGVPDVVKLLDFGLVLATTWNKDSEKLSVRGQITGTPAFLSPEQAYEREDLDARSDIYSLGAVGYFLLSGRPPFEGKTDLHIVVAHMEEPVPPLSGTARSIPADFEAVILRCLEKDPARRFADALSLQQSLANCECAHNWDEFKASRWWQEHPVLDLSVNSDFPTEPSRNSHRLGHRE